MKKRKGIRHYLTDKFLASGPSPICVVKTNESAVLELDQIITDLKSRTKFHLPIFVHGPIGSGKTLLIDKVAESLRNKDQNLQVTKMSSMEFMNRFLKSIQSRSFSKLESEILQSDALLIDDFSFFKNYDRAQDAIARMIEGMMRLGKLVILSSSDVTKERYSPNLCQLLNKSKILAIHSFGRNKKTIQTLMSIEARKNSLKITQTGLKQLATKTKASSPREVAGLMMRISVADQALRGCGVKINWARAFTAR